MAAPTDQLSTQIGIVIARGTLIAVALGCALVGYTLLTTAWAIPVTVTLWLSGAAIAALGIVGPLPRDL